MLMDLFYETLPSSVHSKTRIHFHNFMQDVHKRLHKIKLEHGNDIDAVPFVAADIAEKGNVLCFDEFQCTDVADAMILRRYVAPSFLEIRLTMLGFSKLLCPMVWSWSQHLIGTQMTFTRTASSENPSSRVSTSLKIGSTLSTSTRQPITVRSLALLLGSTMLHWTIMLIPTLKSGSASSVTHTKTNHEQRRSEYGAEKSTSQKLAEEPPCSHSTS